MRALSTLALPVIVWIDLALIMPLMVSVWLKIALLTLQKTVPEPWLVKMLVVMTANNVVLIVAHPVLNLIPVLMLQPPNVAQLVTTAILLVPLVPAHPIQEHPWVLTNADNLVKNVTHLVLRVIHLLQHPNVMIPPPMNAEILVTKKKTATLVPVITNVAVHGNIVRAQLVRLIVLVVVFIVKATTSHTLAVVIMDHVMEIIAADIVLSPATRLKQTLVRMSAA